LHAEIGRLPERFRAPVVLCYLEGRTYEEAARILHCPVGTVKSRLATARQRLRHLLERLELASLAGSVGGEHGIEPATTAMPARLADTTIRAVMQDVAGHGVPVPVSRLAEGVLKTMILNRVSTAVAVLIVVAALATGASGLAWPTEDRPPVGEARAEKPPQANPGGQAPKSQAQVRDGIPASLTGRVVDEEGRPLPDAEVRLKLSRRSFSALTEDSEQIALWQARADAEGRYQIERFHWAQGPGSVYLQADVNAPGFVEFFTFSFWKPAQADTAKGSLPDVRLKRGTNVTGRCIGPDGKAVAGATIQKIFAGLAVSSRGRMPTTDAEGRFRLTRPAGAAELIIYSNRWAPRRVSVPPLRGDLGDVRLEAGVELIGHLRDSIPGGKPLAGKVIALQSTDGGQLDWVPIELACTTDREGSFRVPALKGSYKIWVARGAESGPDECMPIHSQGPPPAVLPRVVDFDPDSQGASPRQELTLLTGQEVAIRGTVTGLDGKPAKGIDLILMAVIGKTLDNSYTTLQWATTDADGRYALTGLPLGLAQSHLMLLSRFHVVPSGHFQARKDFHDSQGVTFEPLNEDQDPLDLRLVTP
jgi:hypothetical protein